MGHDTNVMPDPPQLEVEDRRRFIEQKNPGAHDQGTGKRYALLLHIPIVQFLEANGRQKPGDP